MKKIFITPNATHIALEPQDAMMLGTSTLKFEGEQNGAAGARTKAESAQPSVTNVINNNALDF